MNLFSVTPGGLESIQDKKKIEKWRSLGVTLAQQIKPLTFLETAFNDVVFLENLQNIHVPKMDNMAIPESCANTSQSEGR